MEAPKFKASVNTSVGSQTETKLHFLDYWRIIRIRKTVIMAVFLLVVLTTTAVTLALKPTYMSTSRIQVEKDAPSSPSILQIQQPNVFDPYFINTEFEKIRSQRVLEKVIDELKLTQVWGKKMGVDGGLKMAEAYQQLSHQIDVRQSRNTSLIEIRAYSDDKDEATKIANTIAETYKQWRLGIKKEQSDAGIKALEAEYARQQAVMETKQTEVDNLRQQLQISDVGDSFTFRTTLEPETVRKIENSRVDAENMFTRSQALLEELKKMSRPELRKALPTASPDPILERLLSNLTDTEQRYAVSIKELGDENIEIQKLIALQKVLNQQIEEKIDGILKGIEATVAEFKSNAEKLKETLITAKNEDTKKRQEYAPYFRAQRELDNQKRINDAIFMRKLQEGVDGQIPKESIVTIIDKAQPALKPVRPNVPLNIALGVIVGLIMGFGLAFFIEYLDTSVKTIDDVERALQAPVLGVIPQNVGSLLIEGADSPHAEAYRVLRTNLLFSRKDQSMNTLTVVSGGAGEGKSTTIFNLAAVFAQNGHKVLLVDSDLRRPSLHKLLNVSNTLGLTNFLLRQNSMEEVVQTTALPSLHFLPSGKLPSSSLGILNSTAMREFIHQAKERYDFVFFDSPPIMGVSDASILASEVDMAILVIQYRKYPQVMTLRAKQMVEKVGGNLLGVVLNNINISQDSYYYYYSGYYYDYYSKHDDDKADKGSKKNGEAKKPAVPSTAGERPSLDLKQKY